MKLVLIFLLFILSACAGNFQNEQSLEEVDWLLSSEWIYAQRIEHLKYNNQEITRPPGLEQLILQVQLPTDGGVSTKLHCLFYTLGYKEKKSSLHVVEIKNKAECPQDSLSLDEHSEDYAKIDGIDHFKVNLQNFKLFISFQYKNRNSQIEIGLPNVEAGFLHQKYQALTSKSLMPGLKFLKINDESFDFLRNKNLGKLSDRFSLGTAVRCSQVNKDCEELGENRCHNCRYGWYEVVDFQCPQGGSKFCGQNHCGEKNEPACPRGTRVVALEDAGICQSDLEPRLNEEKILICQ